MSGSGSVESSEPRVPEGMSTDARETWPSAELVNSWLGDTDFGFEWRAGETAPAPDDPEAAARARSFRDVLGRFASGVTVVTANSNGVPVGMTCQSFSSVSLDPPLVLFVPAKTARAWPLMQRAGAFCVNFLADGQQDISNQMASRGADKFAGVDWAPSQATGSPLLADTLGFVDCTVHAVHESGDHYVVIGKVADLGVTEAHKPLLFYQGTYDTVSS